MVKNITEVRLINTQIEMMIKYRDTKYWTNRKKFKRRRQRIIENQPKMN